MVKVIVQPHGLSDKRIALMLGDEVVEEIMVCGEWSESQVAILAGGMLIAWAHSEAKRIQSEGMGDMGEAMAYAQRFS